MSFYISDDELVNYFSKISFVFNNIDLIREHLDIIFVFGSNDNSPNSGRSLFMSYINEKNTPFKFITIEKLYKDLRTFAFKRRGITSEKIKLAHLEYIAIKNAFSILIFPESPGSFAELGYFSAKEDTRKKIIVSNKLKYNIKSTYVNSIIEIIHQDKEIKEILYTDDENTLYFNQYIERLLDNYTDYNEEIFKAKDKVSNEMYQLSVLYEIIRLFPGLIYTELLFSVRYFFDKLSIKVDDVETYLKSMISLLVISNLIKREEFGYSQKTNNVFKVVDGNFSCFKFEHSEEDYLKILKHTSEFSKRKNLK